MDTKLQAQNKLYGTKTQSNLQSAYKSKADSYTAHSLFAQKARDEGHHGTAHSLEETAQNQLAHASLWLSYLDGISDTKANLDSANSVLSDLSNGLSEMALTADEEGFYEIGEKMRLMAEVDKNHVSRLSDHSKALDGIQGEYGENTHFVCKNCGFNFMGNTKPRMCPLCSYPEQYFDVIM